MESRFVMYDAALCKDFGARLKVLEAIDNDDQETVIKVIDAMVAKQRIASALVPLDGVT